MKLSPETNETKQLTAKSPTVFISYTHDTKLHKEKVRGIWQSLRDEGVNCKFDQTVPTPPEGWPRWMENQIEEADFTLVVCTEVYLRRFQGKEEEGVGKGAAYEGAVITQHLYEAAATNTKLRRLLLKGLKS